ncbi:unnamed protein product [marine sediment metagenome]|uniref:Uncharacterized protein n=1 Tax=marine sediment metagenome TaxID=412755 RepID=X0SAY0_9ZZZZ
MSIPLSQKTEKNYENFIARCPICDHRNIFNRCSDLKTFKPIDFKKVECFNCHKSFGINGDDISPPYEYVYRECHKLIIEKHYINCIINLSQSIEMFLAYCIYDRLLWELFRKGIINSTDDVNLLIGGIDHKIKNYSFSSLRNIFFDIYLNRKSFNSKSDALAYIKNFHLLSKKLPSDNDICIYPDKNLITLFMNLKKTKINELRNKVIHKYGYRPSFQEVENVMEETERILFDLKKELKIKYIYYFKEYFT